MEEGVKDDEESHIRTGGDSPIIERAVDKLVSGEGSAPVLCKTGSSVTHYLEISGDSHKLEAIYKAATDTVSSKMLHQSSNVEVNTDRCGKQHVGGPGAKLILTLELQ